MAGAVSAGTPAHSDAAGYDTVLLEVDPAAKVATITLNRPERLNAFDRRMCEEMARIWQSLRTDDRVHAVVLRAAGERAFSAGLDIKSSYGQPGSIWHHEDPGELLSPKWQKMWKPVVCAVQGICTAGAFYFVNESDIVLCAEEATFFDSHVSAGLVSALEPIGLMRRVGLGETLRMALLGNDERVSAATALRIGLVSEVVPRAGLRARAHEIAATIAAKPPSATQGTVKAIWESLDKPYRAALDQGLIYTRLGNPLGTAELAARGGPAPTEPRIR
ncbi:enoyl-CoA hydratase/isomerase family protein [Nocardia asteroides]|uniref:enoyl-CoA hydratase/isomerase family protein n=1 Tax=Nocardia asteroides TaxID=1824 RepID=UPI001E4B2B7A|nr:enoyl-CoA hydratase/isomerase family protein [Nocardia asteroides]UGT62531.1 enoyl-CoA hydratase/isomerase family protein [Nocardia asteroides]